VVSPPLRTYPSIGRRLDLGVEFRQRRAGGILQHGAGFLVCHQFAGRLDDGHGRLGEDGRFTGTGAHTSTDTAGIHTTGQQGQGAQSGSSNATHCVREALGVSGARGESSQ